MDYALSPGAHNIIKQMVSFQPKHFTKLPYGHPGFKELWNLFPEHNGIYIRAKMEITYWTKFEKNEDDKFEALVYEVIDFKKRNMDAKLSDIFNKFVEVII